MTVIRPGQTCWRADPANRVAFLVDNQDYFTAAYEALLRAKKQVILLGWGFDPRTRLAPDGGMGKSEPDEIARILLDISRANPDLDVRLLIWKSAFPVSASQDFFPHRAKAWFRGSRVNFVLDDMVPLGACHHQKVLVVDDQVAFVGGGDFCADRWDSTAHLDTDNRRRLVNHPCHSPRHEVMMMVDGAAARALGEMSRQRWKIATRETIEPPSPSAADAWPDFITPDLEDVDVAIARTLPAWHGAPLVEEIRALTFAAIAGAKARIYIENQYMTSPLYAEAIAARLAEPDGPEVVLMSTERSPSWFDQLTMDKTRALFMRRLREADVFGRFQAYCPETTGGEVIIVHAKTSVFDDDLVRVGSANMNNRSGGFDTEVELVVEAKTGAHRKAIRNFRNSLVGHYLGRTGDVVQHAVDDHGGLAPGLAAMNHGGRLRPIEPEKLTRFERLIAAFHLGDPTQTGDSMRPWKRRSQLDDQIRSLAAGSRPALLAEAETVSKSITNGR